MAGRIVGLALLATTALYESAAPWRVSGLQVCLQQTDGSRSTVGNPGFLQLRLRGGQEERHVNAMTPKEAKRVAAWFKEQEANGTNLTETWEETWGENVTRALEWVEEEAAAAREDWRAKRPWYGEERDNIAERPGKTIELGDQRFSLVSTRMTFDDAGAEYGMFLDIQVGDRPVLLSAICVAAHGLANATASKEWVETRPAAQERLVPLSEPLALSLWTCAGSAQGKELDSAAWTLLGEARNVSLPRINGCEDWEGEWREQWRPNPDDSTEGEWVEPERQEPLYAPAPLRAPLRLEAGERRGFLIHTDHRLGIANRWPKLSDALKLGEPTDASPHITLLASRAMPEPEPFTEESEEPLVECDGTVLETEAEERRRFAHAFLGSVQYEVL